MTLVLKDDAGTPLVVVRRPASHATHCLDLTAGGYATRLEDLGGAGKVTVIDGGGQVVPVCGAKLNLAFVVLEAPPPGTKITCPQCRALSADNGE